MNGSFPFKNKNWLESHYQFFHLSELKNIKQKIELPFFYKILKQLDEATLQGIFKGKNSLLTDKFYLEKNKDIFVFFDLEYKVYDADEFKQFVLDSPYQVKRYKDGKKCFYKDGNMCWRYSFATMLTFTSKRNIILIIASVGIILLLIYLLYTKLKQQRLEDERRRLALQVLTHEFRTPVASLLLSSDEARRHFVDAPDESQEVLLRLSSDIHRLHRLVEASRNYLNLNDGKNLIKLKLSTVESINSFVQYVLEPYEEEIELKLLDFDKKFVLDEYWISICLKNLVENALNHGEKPVKVILKSSAANELKLIIQDQGKIMDDSLKNLTQEFVKGNKSEGTGLGLNIVNKVIKEMGGELTLKTNPTEFTIILRNKK
jgi:anti-sigma regulatory factor (Ser/Thr protein kinase)